jgi:RimJ/RimL family protein N-acetyltransferase
MSQPRAAGIPTPEGGEAPARRNSAGQPIGPPVPGWSARPRPPRTAMTGRHVSVEPISPERHARSLFEAYMEAPDDRDWTYLFVERPEAEAAFQAYVARLAQSADPLHHAVVEGTGGRALGTAAFMRIEPAHGVMEVGSIALAPALQRSRASTEAMYLMMRRAFDELGYRRYEWKCDSLNAPSRAAALRYGFTFEGIFRKAIVYKGRSRDTAWYAITDEEWPRIRAAFEAWLAPDNFEGDGRQRRRLQDIRASMPDPVP